MIWLLVLLILIIGIIAVMTWLQYRILFIPIHDMVWEPDIEYKNLAIPVNQDLDYKIHALQLEEGDKVPSNHIHAWYFEMFPGGKVILFNHGNAGNISHREYLVKFGQTFKVNVLLYDYRGFGLSPGAPSPTSILEDGEAAYRYLRTIRHPRDIIVWGESLGGSVATYIAARNPCRNLLLMSTFSAVDDAVSHKDLSKWVKKPLVFLVGTIMGGLNSKKWLKYVNCPVAIIHSDEDDLIPYECSQIMYSSINHPCKTMITIKGAHSSPKMTSDQLKELYYFCFSDSDTCPSREALEEMVKEIEIVAEKHLTTM